MNKATNYLAAVVYHYENAQRVLLRVRVSFKEDARIATYVVVSYSSIDTTAIGGSVENTVSWTQVGLAEEVIDAVWVVFVKRGYCLTKEAVERLRGHLEAVTLEGVEVLTLGDSQDDWCSN